MAQGNLGSTDLYKDINFNPAERGAGPNSERAANGRALAVNSSGELVNWGPHLVFLSTAGGLGTSVVVSTIASSYSGATLILDGASSGTVFGIPAPVRGMYFRIFCSDDASSNATGFQLPTTAYDFYVPAGASPTTGDLLQSTAANAEGGLSFELIGVSTSRYLVIPGDQPGTTLAASQSS